MTSYRPQSEDTTPGIDRMLVDAWRGMSPAEKFQRLQGMTVTARRLALAGIRIRHPQATERELALRLASLRLPRELMVRLFDWDPDTRGYG